jgi:hypothetical protein
MPRFALGTRRRAGFARSSANRPWADRIKDNKDMTNVPSNDWSAVHWKDIASGAQTKRRGGARPVRNFLDGQGLTGHFFNLQISG